MPLTERVVFIVMRPPDSPLLQPKAVTAEVSQTHPATAGLWVLGAFLAGVILAVICFAEEEKQRHLTASPANTPVAPSPANPPIPPQLVSSSPHK